MTVDTIRDLSDRLERHQRAFYKEGGFEAFSDCKLLFYLGYGRELILPDGRPYEAYLKGGTSGLEITFVGPHLRSPGVETELSHVWFRPQEDGVRVDGSDTELHPDRRAHDFPEAAELLKPFGAWASDGLVRELKRKEANKWIKWKALNQFRELQNSIFAAGEREEMALVKQDAAKKLTEIISHAEHLKKSVIVVPSAEDTAFLEGFISNAGNTTAGWSPFVEPGSAVGWEVLNVQGPLLS